MRRDSRLSGKPKTLTPMVIFLLEGVRLETLSEKGLLWRLRGREFLTLPVLSPNHFLKNILLNLGNGGGCSIPLLERSFPYPPMPLCAFSIGFL